MALNKAALKTGIQELCSHSNTSEEFADGLADLIDTYVKTGTVSVAVGIPVQVLPSTGRGATSGLGTGTIS